MKKWILRILVVALLVTGVSFFALYQAGDKIISNIIDQQLAELDKLEPNPNVILSQAKNPEASEARPSTPTPNSTVILNEVKNLKTPESSSITPEFNPPVILSEAKNLDTPTPTPTITREDLENAKNSITPNDKVSIANMVLKKLNSQDISELTDMLAGGLTSEEKKRAKEIAYSRFSEDEIKTIMELYTKYIP